MALRGASRAGSEVEFGFTVTRIILPSLSRESQGTVPKPEPSLERAGTTSKFLGWEGISGRIAP